MRAARPVQLIINRCDWQLRAHGFCRVPVCAYLAVMVGGANY
jgi:hypothetical protein